MASDEIPRRPDPDPTSLTSAQLFREIGAAKELFDVKSLVTEARFNAMDKAVSLLEKFPTAIDTAVNNLRDLHQEKFEGVGVRFNELNTRLTEGDRYKQTALDAALKAAQTLVDKQQENNKESIKKTEDLFTKQIDGLREIVDDLKSIIRLREGVGNGLHAGWGYLIGSIGAVVGVIATIELVLRH